MAADRRVVQHYPENRETDYTVVSEDCRITWTVYKTGTNRVLFARPHLAQSIAYVLGIVLASGAFIVSLVFFLLRLAERGGSD